MAVTKLSNLSVTSGRSYSSLLAGNPTYVASSFESIATANGTGSSGTITFSSIPSGFKHLQIRGISRNSANSIGALMQFNSDTGSNYAYHLLRGNGTVADAVGVSANTNITFMTVPSSANADVVCASVIDILDYGNSTKNKTVRFLIGSDNNDTSTSYQIRVMSGLWVNTNAITSVSLVAGGSGNWTTATTFALYGIKEA